MAGDPGQHVRQGVVPTQARWELSGWRCRFAAGPWDDVPVGLATLGHGEQVVVDRRILGPGRDPHEPLRPLQPDVHLGAAPKTNKPDQSLAPNSDRASSNPLVTSHRTVERTSSVANRRMNSRAARSTMTQG